MFNKIKHLALAMLASVGMWGQSQTPHKVYPSAAGAAAETRLYTSGGYVGLKAPGSVVADVPFTLPGADGSPGQSLTTDGSGNWVWSTISGSSIPVCTSTTGNDTYTCTISGFTTYTAGYCIVLNVDTANTGTATVNISTVGAKSILGYGGSALSNNDILASVPVIACYDGTDFQLPPGATSSGAFLNGGNTFGANATLGLNDLYTLNIETDNTVRWRVTGTGMLEPGADDTYDIGELTNNRVRGVYSKFVETSTSGGTGDYVKSRMLKLVDTAGGAANWDLWVNANPAGNSNMQAKDNSGSRLFAAWRGSGGSAVNYTYWYSDLLPALRNTVDGDAVTDLLYPSLGSTSYRWGTAYMTNLDVAGSVISDLVPFGSATYNLGESGYRWNQLWTGSANVSGIITQGSDTAMLRLGQKLNTNTSADFGGAAFNTWSTTGSHGSVIDLNKSASATIGTHSAVATTNVLGILAFRGSDGTAFRVAAEVGGVVDGSVSAGIVPGQLVMRTANTSGTLIDRWLVTSSGHLLAGTDNSWDIGASGANRPRNLYLAGALQAPGGCTGCLPVEDTVAIVYGSGDSSKRFRFEVDGLTTGITRTLTVQNGSYTLAGTDINQTFTATETFNNTVNLNNGFSTDSNVILTSTRILSNIVSVTGNWIPTAANTYDLGSLTYYWKGVYGNTFRFNDSGYVGGTITTGANVYPAMDGSGNVGSPSLRYAAMNTFDLTAYGDTYLQTTGIGEASPAKGLLSVYGHNGYAFTPYNIVTSARFRTGANSAILLGTTIGNTSGWTRGLFWSYQVEDIAFTRFKDDETASPINDLYISAGGLVGIGTTAVTEELTVNGSIDVIGSGVIEIAGTTVIDASRNATVANLTITGTCTGCSGLPAVDTTAIVKGSSDATKLLRFEVDGFTTATTRVLTPQNNSYTIAGIDIAQTFTAAQTFNNTVNLNNGFSTDSNVILTSTRLLSNIVSVSQSWLPTTSNLYTMGSSTYRWATLYGVTLDISTTATISGNLTMGGSTNTMNGTLRPAFDGNGSIGDATYKYGSVRAYDVVAASNLWVNTSLILNSSRVMTNVAYVNQDWLPYDTFMDLGSASLPWQQIHGSTYYAGGVAFLDSSRNGTFGTGYFSGSVTMPSATMSGNMIPSLSGGGSIGTGAVPYGSVYANNVYANNSFTMQSGSNSTIYVGSGNMYLRTFSGGDANCTGVTDGWVGIRTDTNEIQVCIGGAVKKGSLI